MNLAEAPRKYSQQKIVDPNFSRISQMSCSQKKPTGGEYKHTHTHTHTHLFAILATPLDNDVISQTPLVYLKLKKDISLLSNHE